MRHATLPQEHDSFDWRRVSELVGRRTLRVTSQAKHIPGGDRKSEHTKSDIVRHEAEQGGNSRSSTLCRFFSRI